MSWELNATKVLDVLKKSLIVGVVGFLLAGVVFVLVGNRDHGFALVAVAVILSALLLLLFLYRSRYRM